MNLVHPLWLVFTLVGYNAADSCKKICRLDDVKCVSGGGSLTYYAVVNGANGVVESMDPLHIEKIEKKKGSTKCVLSNITLIGLKKCKVTLLKLNAASASYKHRVYCPKLTSTFQYEFKSSSDLIDYDQRGTAQVTAYKYKILNKGKYGVQVRGKDHHPQFFLLTNTLKTKLSGNRRFNLTNDCKGDKDKCKKCIAHKHEVFMQQYWLEVEDPIIKEAMKILIQRIDIYCRAFTMGDILPENNKKQCQSSTT